VEQLARLLEAINRPTYGDDGCRDWAVGEIRALGVDKVFPLLRERLKAANPEARCDAITALVFLDAYRAVEPVVSMLDDPDTTVRWYATGCLHDFGDERAVVPLCEVLRRDSDPQVCGTAAYALGGIGSPAAIPSLLAALGSDIECDMHGHSASSGAATALDDILGTNETRIDLGGGFRKMAGHPPDLDRLRRLAQELFDRRAAANKPLHLTAAALRFFEVQRFTSLRGR
jgi:HEAT repeats